MTITTFRNWNNSASSTPQAVAVPKNLQELIEVVKDTENYLSPLRVGGSFHSLNACFASEGTQILLTHFDQIRVDVAAITVTVGAGVKMIQIRDALRPYGALHKNCHLHKNYEVCTKITNGYVTETLDRRAFTEPPLPKLLSLFFSPLLIPPRPSCFAG